MGHKVEELDAAPVTYAPSDPLIPTSKIHHECTQGDFKRRNAPHGMNYRFMANMCLVSIYQYWEDHFRKRIASAINKKKNQIVLPIMGDIRNIRRSILHNDGKAILEVENNKIINCFKNGDEIIFSAEQLDMIIDHVKQDLTRIGKGITSNHGLESTSAPPAAGTLETHP